MNIRITATCAALLAAPLLLGLSGCDKASTSHHHDAPATVDIIDDNFSLVTLTEKAAERIDLQTTEVASHAGADEAEPDTLVIPYSSLVYDQNGNTWVYASPQDKPRSFRREPVKVDRIEGDEVFLAEGPEVGTIIAEVGVAELYGTEIAKGH